MIILLSSLVIRPLPTEDVKFVPHTTKLRQLFEQLLTLVLNCLIDFCMKIPSQKPVTYQGSSLIISIFLIVVENLLIVKPGLINTGTDNLKLKLEIELELKREMKLELSFKLKKKLEHLLLVKAARERRGTSCQALQLAWQPKKNNEGGCLRNLLNPSFVQQYIPNFFLFSSYNNFLSLSAFK